MLDFIRVSSLYHCLKCPVPNSHYTGKETADHHTWYDNCGPDPLPRRSDKQIQGIQVHSSTSAKLSETLKESMATREVFRLFKVWSAYFSLLPSLNHFWSLSLASNCDSPHDFVYLLPLSPPISVWFIQVGG